MPKTEVLNYVSAPSSRSRTLDRPQGSYTGHSTDSDTLHRGYGCQDHFLEGVLLVHCLADFRTDSSRVQVTRICMHGKFSSKSWSRRRHRISWLTLACKPSTRSSLEPSVELLLRQADPTQERHLQLPSRYLQSSDFAHSTKDVDGK